MGVSQKAIRGFTLAELLVAMVISSALLAVVAVLYQTGLWEFRHSAAHIELSRRGRTALDRLQPYISSAIKPNPSGSDEAILFPDTFFDDLHQATESRVQFYTPVDHLGGAPMPDARTLQENPLYYIYEIAEVPGPLGRGNELVLRRYLDPVTPDLSVPPLVLARALGEPDPENPGAFYNGFGVRYLRPGSLEFQVVVSSALLQEDDVRARVEARTPMNPAFTSIIQIPYYSQR